MADPVKELLVNAKGNCGNDRVNKLLAEANFPCHPEHSRLSDFDPACLSVNVNEYLSHVTANI